MYHDQSWPESYEVQFDSQNNQKGPGKWGEKMQIERFAGYMYITVLKKKNNK